MDGNLPTELIENILFRLPIKSLLRFTTVSNSWASTITSHQFHVAHHKYIKSSTHNIFWIPSIPPTEERGYLIQIKGQEVQRLSMVCPPESSPWYRNICCCNGLILSTYGCRKKRMYEVWNPSTGSCIKFQCPYKFSMDYLHAFHGLCYDPLVSDCKVVISNMKKYAVFDCVKNHWTEIKEVDECIMQDSFLAHHMGALSLNGDFFWIVSMSRRDLRATEIVCFDSREEKFKKLPKPAQHYFEQIKHIRFVSMGDQICLHMVLWTSREPRQVTFQLKIDGGQYSWKNLHLCLPTNDDLNWYWPRNARGKNICPVYLQNENEILLRVSSEKTGEILLYNSTEQAYTQIKQDPKIVCGKPIVPFHSTLFGFT